jgi:hypothetical protein
MKKDCKNDSKFLEGSNISAMGKGINWDSYSTVYLLMSCNVCLQLFPLILPIYITPNLQGLDYNSFHN